MNKIVPFFSVLILVGATTYAAETGKPFMTGYTSKETGGYFQNWSFIQDNRGVMYIGNGFGVQEFDGSTWRLIVSPNETFARSLAMDANGRIYVGSSGMFGYLAPDDHGSMQYMSLLDCIKPEDQVFSYFWTVQATPEGIYFQTRERLFRFCPAEANANSKKPAEKWQVKVWKPQNNFLYTFWIDQTLYVQQSGIGLMKMTGDSLVLIAGGKQFSNDRMQIMLPFPGKAGSYLLGTFNRGLFLWDEKGFQPFRTDSDDLLRNGILFTGVNLPDDCFAFGTWSNGMFIIDSHGKTKLHLILDSGLLSNTITTLFVDAQKNLWAGMDGGIVVLEYNSPLTQFGLPAGSSPVDFRRHKGILYACANNGVYYLDDANSQFKLISGITGTPQAFDFCEINNELFVAVGSGIFRIQDTNAILVLQTRYPSFVPICFHRFRQDTSIVFNGTLSGLTLLRYEPHNPNHLSIQDHVAGINEFIRSIIEPEPGILWLGTLDAGTIRLAFADNNDVSNPIIERFGTEHGLPSGGTTVYQTAQGLAFCTKRGVYKFDPEQRTFSPDPFFDEINVGRSADEGFVISDQDGNIWANLGSETVVFKRKSAGTYQLQKELLSRFADDSALSIYPEKDGNVWFGTTNFAIRLAPDKTASGNTSFPALIRCVSFANDSVIYNGTQTVTNRSDDPAGRSIPFRFNALCFDYSLPSYSNPQANEFRSRLEGFDKSWSAWKRETRREYTNLPAGKYRFRVQARNIFKQASEEAVYAFAIQHPWYITWWAYICYVLVATGLFFGLVCARTHQLQQRSKALEKIVQERTAEIKSQKDNIEQLSRIGRDITDNLSIKAIINTVYENVNSLMDASVFGIGLFQAEKQSLIFPATKEKGETLLEFMVPLSDDDRLAVWCFKNQQDVIINDYGKDYIKYIQQLKPAVAGENPESILYLPLQHKDKKIGVITAQSFSKNAYTEYHLNMLRNLATYSAIALENADAYHQVNELLNDLKATQEKLVMQSKLAALGALTAGIAHEIKNPLNFVNNFAELSSGLLDEFKEEVAKKRKKLETEEIEIFEDIINTLQQNANKIKEHGKRADSIVKSMLQHSRGKSGERQPTDINAMLEEDINLAYHGMRAQDSDFNIKIETDLDPSIGKLNVVPQDISRVFLNIINNGCYEAHRKKMEQDGSFSPTLSVRTRNMKDRVEIRIRDNGNGVPKAVRDKLFTPFFTTKPAGQGTGLGLSISYDIVVHGHNGQISFETEEGRYTEFIIAIPS